MANRLSFAPISWQACQSPELVPPAPQKRSAAIIVSCFNSFFSTLKAPWCGSLQFAKTLPPDSRAAFHSVLVMDRHFAIAFPTVPCFPLTKDFRRGKPASSANSFRGRRGQPMGSHNDFSLRSSRTSATGIRLSLSSRRHKLPLLRRPSFTVTHFGPLGVWKRKETNPRLRRFLASRSRLPGRFFIRLGFEPVTSYSYVTASTEIVWAHCPMLADSFIAIHHVSKSRIAAIPRT
jgi:hypothetical protein